jgi:hypothetical protein
LASAKRFLATAFRSQERLRQLEYHVQLPQEARRERKAANRHAGLARATPLEDILGSQGIALALQSEYVLLLAAVSGQIGELRGPVNSTRSDLDSMADVLRQSLLETRRSRSASIPCTAAASATRS